MSSLSIALILGIPLIALLLAVCLMVWRAFNPKRNAIRGLTNSGGQVVNPYIHAGVSFLCLAIAMYCYWRLRVFTPVSQTMSGRLGERLNLWALALISTGLSIKFFKQYKRFKNARARSNA